MFYPNNSYMEDLYFYNQIPNTQFMGNQTNAVTNNQMIPGVGNFGNMYQMNPGANFGNTNMFMPGQIGNNGMSMQNLNNLYPSIYRIINPVISKVVSNGSNQVLNEEVLNNMVDTVFNIVEGQIDLEPDNHSFKTTTNENQSVQNQTANTGSNLNTSTRTGELNRQTTSNSNRNNRCDTLLKDLIKILIIKEILLKNHLRMVNMQSQNGFNPYYNLMTF